MKRALHTSWCFVLSGWLSGFAASWSPNNSQHKKHQHRYRELVAGALVAGLVSVAPLPSQAAQSINIEADLPALVQVAKDNKEELLRLAKAAAEHVKIAGLPDNKVGFVRDAAAGDILLTVNGIPLDVTILSEKGSVDVELAAEPGDLSFTVSSQYLPKLPLFRKRFEGMSPAETATRTVDRLEAAVSEPVSVWDSNNLDVLNQGWTNKQVIGTTSLALGLAYGGAYLYYDVEMKQAEKAAEKKKQENALKRKAKAAATVKKQDAPKTVKKEAKPITPRSSKMQATKENPELSSSSRYVVPQEE